MPGRSGKAGPRRRKLIIKEKSRYLFDGSKIPGGDLVKTILIVDDEVYTRDHLGKIIEKQGFKALTAGTGEDGIKLYRENRPDYVLLDILLPGIDGEDVFKYIKEIDPDAKIFFITGCDNIFSVEDAVKMGAKGFLTKPIFVDDIMKLLNTLETHKQMDFFNPES